MKVSARTPAECFPLGEYLQEELAARGWTPADVADRIGGTEKERDIWCLTVDLLIHCSDMEGLELGQETAEALGRAFDVSPDYWLNLHRMYRQCVETRQQPSEYALTK